MNKEYGLIRHPDTIESPLCVIKKLALSTNLVDTYQGVLLYHNWKKLFKEGSNYYTSTG